MTWMLSDAPAKGRSTPVALIHTLTMERKRLDAPAAMRAVCDLLGKQIARLLRFMLVALVYRRVCAL